MFQYIYQTHTNMRTFSEHIHESRKLNESAQKGFKTKNDFIAFGKEIMHGLMGVNYNENAVNAYLSEMYDSEPNSERLLERFNEETMSKSEKKKSVVSRFNSILTQLFESSADHVLQAHLIKLVNEYPTFLNECALNNTEVLLEMADVTSKFKINEDTRKQNLVMKSFNPETVEQLTNIMKVMGNVLHEAVLKTVPGTWQTKVLPDGYGGFDVDYVEIVNNQLKKAENLETSLKQAIAQINAVSEEDIKTKNDTAKMYFAWRADTDDRYNLSAEKMLPNIPDLDFFIYLCIDDLLKPLKDNEEHLRKNFPNVSFTKIDRLFNEYIINAGLENTKYNESEPNYVFHHEPLTYAKLYELNDLVLNLSKYQQIYKRQLALKILQITKPMIDSIRLDKQIYLDRTQLQY